MILVLVHIWLIVSSVLIRKRFFTDILDSAGLILNASDFQMLAFHQFTSANIDFVRSGTMHDIQLRT